MRCGRSRVRWSPRLRSARGIAFIAAQSALLFGYYLWGGVKELAAAMLIASVAACLAGAVAVRFEPRALLAPALFAAALAAVLSAGGLIWLAPMLALAGALAVRRLAPRVAGARLALLAGIVALLALPALTTGGVLPPTASPLTDADARGQPDRVAGAGAGLRESGRRATSASSPSRRCPPRRWSR